MQWERLYNPTNDIGRNAQVQCNLRQVMKRNDPPHDKCIPKQAIFRSKLEALIYVHMHMMPQGHGRMFVSSEQETAGPSRGNSLSRQRRQILLRAWGVVSLNFGTIVSIPNPIEQKDRTGASIKVVLEGKGRGKIGFAVHAAQTSRKYVQVWSKRK